MAVSDTSKATKKEYEYGDIRLSLENCILPPEMLDETPSMKDGLDRDKENDLRNFGCEIIQTSGMLLKLPQVAMATGQVILQRFYYIKSMVKHDIEANAMAAIFLAAKIEECPRRLRDIINVCNHIKQKMLNKPETPMDYYGNQYLDLKNNVIKAERRILKELGFCVHVKHPHKIIITYLQILEHEKNVALARKAWNYMNDSLRTDVFVRFFPDIIACACIFLAARTVKVNLPMKPPWWELFDASYDEIEDISLCILRLYSRKRIKITYLEAVVKKLKKENKLKANKDSKDTPTSAGSFTPNQNSTATISTVINNAESNVKPPSKNASPVNAPEKRPTLNSVVGYKKMESRFLQERKHSSHKKHKEQSESDYSSEDSSDSETELPSKKYEKQREQYETNKKRRSASSDSDADQRSSVKTYRTNSPNDGYRKSKYNDYKDRSKSFRSDKESNGKISDRNHDNYIRSRRSRSRSPAKRGRSVSPYRKGKYEKSSEKSQSKTRYLDKYSTKVWR